MASSRTFVRLKALTITGLALGLLGSGPVLAQAGQAGQASAASTPVGAANINITPRRVVFEGAKRTEAVYVFNQGSAPVTVDVALVDNIMLPSGEIVPLTLVDGKGAAAKAVAARLQSAKDLMLATPSRLVLEPGRGRTVRVRASLPTTLDQAGEWRTHLTVTTIPQPSAGLTAEAAASAESRELSFQIQSVFGISIPLILRAAGHQAAAAIDGVRVVQAPPAEPGGKAAPMLELNLNRTGNASVFGNIEVRGAKDKAEGLLGFVRGLSVYTEIPGRTVLLPLNREPLPGETLSVTYVSEEGSARRVLAEARVAAK